MQTLQKLEQRLKPLLQSKSGRIKLAAGAGSFLILLLIVIVSSGSSEPTPIIVQSTPQVVEKAAPSAPPNVDNSKTILELFNPSDASLTQQQTQASQSDQIEQTLTVTFILTKCQIISQDDYSTIFQALILYAQRINLAADATSADAKVREIAESAKASYALVYGRTSCEDPKLPSLANDIMNWAKALFTQ